MLQLVDQGLLELDDSQVVEQHLPELATQPVLTGYDPWGKPILVPRTLPLTVRRLKDHTAGGCLIWAMHAVSVLRHRYRLYHTRPPAACTVVRSGAGPRTEGPDAWSISKINHCATVVPIWDAVDVQ